MFRVFRAEWYEKKLYKLSTKEQERVKHFEQDLKQNPFQGKAFGLFILQGKEV